MNRFLIAPAAFLMASLMVLTNVCGPAQIACAAKGISLRALKPTLDLSNNIRPPIQGRIEQIETASAGDKLPLPLTQIAFKNTPWLASAHAVRPNGIQLKASQMQAAQQVDSEFRAAQAKVDNSKSKPEQAAATTLESNIAKVVPLKIEASQPKQEAPPKPVTLIEKIIKPAPVVKFARQDPADMWAGHIKKTEGKSFQSDPSLSLHINVGEYGCGIFRFVLGPDGKQTLHPSTLFFSGRDIPYSKSLEQQQLNQDPNRPVQQVSIFQSAADTLNRLCKPFTKGILPEQPEPLVHFKYVYLHLGTAMAYDKLGHYFLQNLVHTTTTVIDKNTIEQDSVIELTSNDGDSLSTYREVVVRWKKIKPDQALITIAKVSYAADRSIVGRQMFEGTVSTTGWHHIADEISDYTGRSFDKTALENNL